MIRTAILAGLLLVMLSIAYGRPGLGPETAPSAAAVVEEQPRAKADVPNIGAQPVSKRSAAAAPAVPLAAAVRESPVPPILPAAERKDASAAPPTGIGAQPDLSNSRADPVPSAPPIMADAARASENPKLSPSPAEPLRNQVSAVDVPAPALHKPLSLVPPPVEAEHSAPSAVADMPVINVPTRPVMMPWEAPPRAGAGSAVAAVEPTSGAEIKQAAAAASGFMAPRERSRELYLLAREMEETFINKLAR